MSEERKFWADRYVDLIQRHVEREPVLQKIVEEKGWICYDEKTPSGRIHIGSGRGWVIHATVAQALRDAGLKGRFILSSDDMDPMDDLPRNDSEKYKEYMGIPFRFIPSPVTGYESYGDYFFKEATSRFPEYRIEAELERTGDHYFNGDFNQTIKLALNNAARIQEVYSRFHKTAKTEEVFPFKPICENCGKIGTTISYEWDPERELVSYRCSSDHVAWAQGCGHEGQTSPFNGSGKLPWKVEWAAKWPTIGVVFETAGKDHFSAGGSRDIAMAVAREVFDFPPPFPSSYKKSDKGFSYIPGESYEFFTIGGKKMSTSRGAGFPFAEMGNYAPGYITKFLLVRTRPKSAIDFDPSTDLERVYRDYDDTERKYYLAIKDSSKLEQDDIFNAHRLFQLCSISEPLKEVPPQIEFNFGVMLVQITDNTDESINRLIEKGFLQADLLPEAIDRVKERLDFLRKWVGRLAPEDKVIQFNSGPMLELADQEKKAMQDLVSLIQDAGSAEEKLISGIQRIYAENGLDVKAFHRLVYRVLFGKDSGPRLVPYILYAGKPEVIKQIYRRSGIPNPTKKKVSKRS